MSMLISKYLSNNKFYFVDRVNFSKNKKVIRVIFFNKARGNIISSGKITCFKNGTYSYNFTINRLGEKDFSNYESKHTSLEGLGDRLHIAFG